ncbi:MAG TPA: xanthine dehydrogenase family protein subunit M [Hyphomicrobiaceae bacterium]|nr:xanthine dehydrogenase family protein subunit M [Hyphomicrobiaceae bacterium]
MKAAPFSYLRAASLADIFDKWEAAGPDARLLAGGQSLLATLAFRLSTPSTLIDVSRVPELAGISGDGGRIRVGALTTHAELGAHPLVREQVPLLAAAVPLIAHPAVRNRGTIGGSLAYADPAAELPACCVALDAVIIAQSATAERRIQAAQFFTGLYATALGEKELIAAIEFPTRKAQQRSTILELARRSGDYAMAGVVARAEFKGEAFVDGKFVFFGVGEAPVAARAAVLALTGRPLTDEAVARAAAALDTDLDPPADQHASAAMRRHLARVLLGRALRRLSRTEEACVA